MIVCHKCKNNILVAYDHGTKRDSGKNFAKAMAQAKNGLGKRFKLKSNKIYSFDKDPKYKVFEAINISEFVCKCGGRIEIIKDYDRENNNQIKLTLVYKD